MCSVYDDYDLLHGIKNGRLVYRPKEKDYIALGTARLTDSHTVSELLKEGLITKDDTTPVLTYVLTEKGGAALADCRSRGLVW